MKDIKGYEGKYAVTTDGRVYSYSKERFMSQRYCKGYPMVNLFKDGKKTTRFVHRLVAETYIPNPDNLPQVNHLDENPGNPRLENLEWCTAKGNINYGTSQERRVKSRQVPVYCEELDKVFESGKVAAETLGLFATNICGACRGKYKTTGGMHFRYAEVSA